MSDPPRRPDRNIAARLILATLAGLLAATVTDWLFEDVAGWWQIPDLVWPAVGIAAAVAVYLLSAPRR